MTHFLIPYYGAGEGFQEKEKRISGYKTETNPSILIKMTPKNLRRQRKKKSDRQPLHPFVTIKALNHNFLMFPLQKKERENNIFAWNDFSFFTVNQNTQSRGVYTG